MAVLNETGSGSFTECEMPSVDGLINSQPVRQKFFNNFALYTAVQVATVITALEAIKDNRGANTERTRALLLLKQIKDPESIEAANRAQKQLKPKPPTERAPQSTKTLGPEITADEIQRVYDASIRQMTAADKLPRDRLRSLSNRLDAALQEQLQDSSLRDRAQNNDYCRLIIGGIENLGIDLPISAVIRFKDIAKRGSFLSIFMIADSHGIKTHGKSVTNSEDRIALARILYGDDATDAYLETLTS